MLQRAAAVMRRMPDTVTGGLPRVRQMTPAAHRVPASAGFNGVCFVRRFG